MNIETKGDVEDFIIAISDLTDRDGKLISHKFFAYELQQLFPHVDLSKEVEIEADFMGENEYE